MPRVMLNFDHHHHGGFAVHFIEADCRTPISQPTRYIKLANEAALRAFIARCNPEPNDLDHDLRAWGRSSIYVNLTAQQYTKLKYGKLQR